MPEPGYVSLKLGERPTILVGFQIMWHLFFRRWAFRRGASAMISGIATSRLMRHETPALQSFTLRKRSALAITETELRLMAAPAMIGLRRKPNQGYKIPAAIGMPNEL